MIAGKRYVGVQVDIWSTGVIMYALICGYLPFEDKNTSNLYKKIMAGEFQIPKFVSNEARDLLKKVLNIDPEQRYTLEKIKQHQWYNMQSPKENIREGIYVGKNQIAVDHYALS